jgi:hypothetical protein
MSESTRTLYYGKVLETNDPLGLGRIRALPVDWQQQAYQRALPVGELQNVNDKWTLKDPFLIFPLLPIFLYQVPKEGEFIHIVYYDNEYKENNRFYIQGNFSSIDLITQEPFDSMVNGLALGERNKPSQGKITPTTRIPLKVDNQGLYPEPETIAILGRKNSDILFPENGFIARVNKQFDDDTNPTFNKKYSFTSLQYYPNRETDSTITNREVISSVYQNVNYLIEYNVYGGLGTITGNFSGYIEVYKISPYRPITTSAFTENTYYEVDEESKIGPIYRKDYVSESFNTITRGFRQIILNLNNLNIIGLTGEPLNRADNTFPFVYQPNKQLYEKTLNGNNIEIRNAKRFIDNVFFNETDVYRGYGILSQKNTLGVLKEPKQVEIVTPNYENIPTTVGITAADFLFLLSHETQIPKLLKIDFQDTPQYTGNTLDQQFIWKTILPNTNSMVRGEKLLDLIELILRFMINHVHPFHNMPPVPVAKDQTTVQEILTKFSNAYSEILNQKLRIN